MLVRDYFNLHKIILVITKQMKVRINQNLIISFTKYFANQLNTYPLFLLFCSFIKEIFLLSVITRIVCMFVF